MTAQSYNIFVVSVDIFSSIFNFEHLQDLFGLPCSTTCDNFKPNNSLYPGCNADVIHQAVQMYEGRPVIDASDEARALRYGETFESLGCEFAQVLLTMPWMLDPTYFLSLFLSFQLFFRYLQAIQNDQGEGILVGKNFSSDMGQGSNPHTQA